MKLSLLFFNSWTWFRQSIGGRRPPSHGHEVGGAATQSDATRGASSLPSASHATLLTSAARARLTALRADALVRHRLQPVVPSTVFDESVFDGFRERLGDDAGLPDNELRTVFVPRDEAYAATLYLPRTGVSRGTSAPR